MGRPAASTVRPRAAIAGLNAGVDIIAGVRRGIPKENVEPHYDINEILDKHPDGIAMLDNTVEKRELASARMFTWRIGKTRLGKHKDVHMCNTIDGDDVASRCCSKPNFHNANVNTQMINICAVNNMLFTQLLETQHALPVLLIPLQEKNTKTSS